MTGREFRAIRNELGLTQAQLAEKLGFTRFHIGNLEDSVSIRPVYALAIQKLAADRNNEAA